MRVCAEPAVDDLIRTFLTISKAAAGHVYSRVCSLASRSVYLTACW